MRWFKLFSSGFRVSSRRFLQTAGGAAVFASGGYFTACAVSHAWKHFPTFREEIFQSFPLKAFCAEGKHELQSSVISQTKQHALYLIIHLSPTASFSSCLKALADIDKQVDKICPPDLRSEEDEILYGVGFGPSFYATVNPSGNSAGVVPYEHKSRHGPLGDMPNTGGDIFIHAKCDERGKLFELAQSVIDSLPQGAVARFEDTYGWVYRGGRDLSGFIDGTANPADEDDRYEFAVCPKTGGSYVITQKWIHLHDVIRRTKDNVLESWIGRTRTDSTALPKKPINSHVARMIGGNDPKQVKPFEIVRQSQPWGTVSGDSGLFFIAYSKSPVALDWMLDRMTATGHDGKADDVMRLSRCVASTYWYFPNQAELKKLFHSGGGGRRGLWG